MRQLLLLFLCFTVSIVYSQIRINEAVSSNTFLEFDPDFGAYADWIELYNYSDSAVDISGWKLGDSRNQNRWTLPSQTIVEPKTYLRIWADGQNVIPGDTAERIFTIVERFQVKDLHTNFSLSADGEDIFLSDSMYNRIDKIYLPPLASDVSWAWYDDGYKLNGSPTPGSENSPDSLGAALYASAPAFSLAGGYTSYNAALELSATEGAEIYYTTDGSIPNRESVHYSEPLTIAKNITIRARAFELGKLPSPVVTQTFIVGMYHDLPVVSVTADAEDLWGFDFGVHKRSLKEREVPVHIELYETDGSLGFSVNAGMQLFGSQIFTLPQKPMGFYFKGKYGNSMLDYQLFPDKDITGFKNFVLRNGGNDNGITMFRDALVQSIATSEMDYDYQAYRPAAVYLNGEYWGLYNIREKLNANSILQTHGVAKDRIDLIEDNLDVKEGSADNYQTFLDYLAEADMASDEVYAELQNQMDVDEFLNYFMIKLYAGYNLWDWNNKYWRDRGKNGRWRWFLFDMEHSFMGPSGDYYTENSLAKTFADSARHPEWSDFLMERLLENPQFRNNLIQRMAVHLNRTFAPERVTALIDSLQTNIATEMDLHIYKWSAPSSIQQWEQNVSVLYGFAKYRPAVMTSSFEEFFQLAESPDVAVNFDSQAGLVAIQDVPVKDSSFQGKLFAGVPVSLKAIAKPGYRFVGWKGIGSEAMLNCTLHSDTIFTALFEPFDEYLLPDTVHGTVMLDRTDQPYKASRDVVIPKGSSLIIKEGVTIEMAEKANVMVHGRMDAEGSVGNPIVIRADKNAYAQSNPSAPEWGAICAMQGDSVLRLAHVRLENATHGSDKSLYKAAISARETDVSLFNVEIPQADNPVYCFNGSVYIHTCTLHSEAVCDLINLEQCQYATIKNCRLIGNYAEDADAMDLDNVDSSRIEGNYISGFFGGNSDGIDLGGGSHGNEIVGNQIYNCQDKGISIGSQANAFVHNNIIVGCGQGVGIKDSLSFATIDRNTFYENGIGVACFVKQAGRGSGNAYVVNNIFSHCAVPVMFEDNAHSDLLYSLADNREFECDGCLKADPLFENPALNNFNLTASSPCIDAGNPLSPADADGSRADMGALFQSGHIPSRTIIFTELNYNAANLYDNSDWLELYNYGTEAVDLSYWVFKDGNNAHEFIIPSGTIIEPENYLVLSDNAGQLQTFDEDITVIGDFDFGLSARGEALRLFDAEGMLVCQFRYGHKFPWPKEADGHGVSMEALFAPSNLSDANRWKASTVLGGTPGYTNSSAEEVSGILINELLPSNTSDTADASGKTEDWIELLNISENELQLGGLYLTDDPDDPAKSYIPRYHPDSTLIPSDSFYFLWADDDRNEGINHLNFKLSTQGEYVGIYQIVEKDTLLIDEVYYSAMGTDTAYGRFTDGADNWQKLQPTPLLQNQPFDVVVSVTEHVDVASCSPNPFSDYLHISIPQQAELSIFRADGVVVVPNILLSAGANRIETNHLSTGVYVVEVKAESGNQKFRVVKNK